MTAETQRQAILDQLAQLNKQVMDLTNYTAVSNQLAAAMAEELGRLSETRQPLSPNYRRPLLLFSRFDWHDINAQVNEFDDQGATLVTWASHLWKRRSGSGKYGKAIWFSRPSGEPNGDSEKYYRLITFKDWDEVEPLADDLAPATAPAEQPNPLADEIVTALTGQPVGAEVESPAADLAADKARADAMNGKQPAEPGNDNPHLRYGNKTTVPTDERTISIFNQYLAAEQHAPADPTTLKLWWKEQTK